MATPTSRVRAAAGALLVLAVAFYAPLSFTYFWNGHSGPNLQDDVFKLLISPTFAFGHGSGHDVRPDTHEAHFATFASTYVTMWIHSVVGTTALVAGLSQFSERLRRARPGVHRTLGKVFLLCCLGVAATAASYLLQTPATDVFSGRVFEEVLWILAAGTAGLALLAFVSIRRRDLVAHREFATAAFALICSAGWLRLEWMSVSLFWQPGKEMLNLFGIQFAATFLITCSMLYVQKFWKGNRRADSPLATTGALRIAAAVGAPGIVALAVLAATTTDWSAPHAYWFTPGWAPVVVGCFLPYVVHTAWLARMARQAQQRGNGSAAAAWRTYLAGALVAPTTGALAYGFGVLVHGMNTQEAWYMVGYLWGGTLVLAYVAHATVTTRWARRATPTPATAGGELQPA
ncbi:hypothetical protein GCM10011584_31370 [Nocardioides phosphati]|uniref:DUF2306 domain-containing protein n=1 Tax=Nocardioides phosphati TaxID=1867775 RepID=A0ABQ2NFP8_9ACTN|nr:DUF2306 domain-containing protein [Nocardioides phosphati]GGO93205.1 hypothetical protein GCM10011584_31370 [Nocardioides phosphati]